MVKKQIGFNPQKTSLLRKLKNPLSKLGHLPAYRNQSRKIDLEEHTKTYFDQFSRKKTVYCHINPETLQNPVTDDETLDEANVYNVIYSGEND